MPYTKRIEIRWRDMDGFGHVNNAVYLTYLEEARDEFYKRVTYANQHFSAGTQGWRTDMGRIYIKYGQPDEVVRNPFRFEGPPEEIWYYYRARYTFFFVDRDGFGRYEIDDSRSTKID